LLGGFLAATWSYALLSLRMHGDLLRVTALALLAAIVLSLALVPSSGAQGASIASAACEFIVAGGYLLALARRHAHLRPTLTLLPKVALAAAPAAAALALPLPSIALWAIASTIYFGLLALTRAFPAELMHVLLRRSGSDA
jgi:O-antigen/teichoic acid export membrane protein